MLIHYVIVRRDLSLGVLAAMVTHAAGESAAKCIDFKGCTAVVLGVKDELELHRVVHKLYEANVSHVRVVESDEPYTGQLMAIGLKPVERDVVYALLRPLQTLKTLLDNPGESSV